MIKAAVVLLALFAAPQAIAQNYPRPDQDRVTARIEVETFGDTRGIAPGVYVRPINALSIELIKHFEGWEPKPYDDAAQYCTVGFGHLIKLAPCATLDPLPFAEGISLERGSMLLEADSAAARLAVQKLVTVPLNDAQFGALSSFVFNVGAGRLATSTLLKRLNAGHFDLAAAELTRWVKAGGKTLRGLVDRRACERALFLGLVTFNIDGEFERSSCAGRGIAPPSNEIIDIELGE